MTLIKTSLLNGIAVVIKMLTLLGLNKILAIYVGPAGYASVGQFQNAIQMITTLASGAINTGVVKYTAEYYENPAKQHAVWRTAGTISLAGSIAVAMGVVAFNKSLAGWFLKDESFGSVFIWFAATLVLFVFNTLLLAILNGKKEIQRYVTANIAGSLFAMAVITLMAIHMGLYGALVGLAIYQSLTFFVTLAVTCKANWFKFEYLIGGVDKSAARNLAKFTVMSLTSAVCIPLSHIFIRDHLGRVLGWDAAGYWEAMWRLSSAYLMLASTTLGVYYLPRLSELKEKTDIRKEVLLGYRVILPIAALCSLFIYILRDYIIHILFTDDFVHMEVLFSWQVIGDTLKIASWLLGYLVTAKALVGIYIFSEVFFSLLFFLLVTLTTSYFGLESASIAYAVNYFFHFLFMIAALKIKRVI
ncbi:O-antigen translocase [Sansalvadorimonas verongulae]|uniref:O-antigen translocase n=1 Tax=Sansalvadorimonas verongulae TaxID=2172824 RepID=UPI0012BC3A4B|nr:O-antigen translocase [Sansalvadorimonas verongulae]MTI11968.1 O-antigen translocase [Sansalvadorimonas verongulae]